jgi:putative flippase GtrA
VIAQLALGALAISATVAIHAAFMVAAGRVFRRPDGRPTRGQLRQALRIIGVVLWFFLSLCVQCWAWAALLLSLGAFGELEEALYFATVTYTTLGYGDVVLEPDWRLLGAVAATNGTIVIGWTTAMVFLAVQRTYGDPRN